jgi:hypothetical protein
MFLIDKKYRLPRIWSNDELKKFANLFDGDIVNVSAWKDEDKEGKKYKDYFINAKSYSITNYKKEARGFQGTEGEIFLNLEESLPNNLINKFDVVFNHTVLEHVYDFKKSFENLCLMSRDIVIIIVPFLQEMHSDYGDYWRFTPLAIKNMFEENSMEVIYSSFNEHKKSSVYLFFIASKKPGKWDKIKNEFFYENRSKVFFGGKYQYVGSRSISNSFLFKARSALINRANSLFNNRNK